MPTRKGYNPTIVQSIAFGGHLVRVERVFQSTAYPQAEEEMLVFFLVFVFVLMLILKRVGERFQDLDISSVLIAAMDVTNESPPPELPITFATLPTIVLLTADDKRPPYRYDLFLLEIRNDVERCDTE